MPRAPIGANLLQAYRGQHDPRAHAIATAIVAVFEGKASYFELQHRASSDGRHSYVTSVSALLGARAGAVVIDRVLGRSARLDSLGPANVTTPGGAPIGDTVDRLTPREREVLDLMAAGMDNRAIAAKLGIGYTTVRGHVRSIIDKLGARSRLEAVARAYRTGMVPR